MADRMLFIGWDEIARGREQRAQEVFNEAMGHYGRLQQEGRIESFDVVFLDPTGSGLQGYMELHGTADQLNALQEDEAFRRLMIDASLVCEDFRTVRGRTNAGVAEEFALWTDAIERVPQATG